ncbi:MAG TPA: hypothetical protein VJ801_02275 [Polyangia bacterium]|jgi:hypothetical protein|nr:hypothetical protein [Polyangia bacterium]
MDLANQGQVFLGLLRGGSLGDHKTRFRSWLAQIERLVQDGVDAAGRMAFDDGLIAFREFFGAKGGAMVQDQLVGLLAQMVVGLNDIRRGRGYKFKPTDVPDEDFARFLRAAQFEDKQLTMGEALSLEPIAKTAKLEMKTARSCLAHLVDEDLGYELEPEDPSVQEECFQIEYERVEFRLEEMFRNPPRSAQTPTDTPGPDDISTVPVAYRHLAADLERFHRDDPRDRSVFVMMKFPDPANMDAWQLQCLEDIYGAVKDELDRHGLVARRADKKVHATSKQLWDNLCIYMLGCRYGVAILEDHVGDELNPNVALEYGFMKGLGREVVLLKERRFKHLRADLVGTIPKEFDIGADHALDRRSIQEAVSNWLIDIEVPPKRAR